MCDKKQLDVDMASVSPLITEILAAGNSAELTVSGNSMRPLLTHRVSRVRLASAVSFRRGDVVFYRRDNGAFVLHRVVKQTGSLYTMRGDNQLVSEPGIRKEQIIAVMTAYSRDSIHWHGCRYIPYVLYCTVWMRTCFFRRLLRAFWRKTSSLKR